MDTRIMNRPTSANDLFRVKLDQKIGGKKFYINFVWMDGVAYPPVDLSADQLVEALANSKRPGGDRVMDSYKIPFCSSPFFACLNKMNRYNFVINVALNETFAAKLRVDPPIQHYVITLVKDIVMERFNTEIAPYVGHQYYFHGEYGYHLKFKPAKPSLNLRELHAKEANRRARDGRGIRWLPRRFLCRNRSVFLPRNNLLECFVQAGKLPDSIVLNDDTFILYSDGEQIADVVLPNYIDLSKKFAFNYNEEECYFKTVFELLDSRKC